MTSVNIPQPSAIVSVSIIDTTSRAFKIPCQTWFEPRFEGLKTFDICSYAFLITHTVTHTDTRSNESRRVIFDLGIRRDWKNLVPVMVELINHWGETWGTKLEIQKDVADILTDHGTDLRDIEAIIWSHLHWDHTGNPAKFPESTKIIVGPGVKEKHMPGWPANPRSWIRESDVSGRDVVEIGIADFTKTAGGMPAYDYFGDGSFFILNAPGHSLGHLNALAKTSNDPESFIFIAADSVHLGGEVRPSKAMPLPDPVDIPRITPRPCPADVLLQMHPRNSATLPFLGLHPSFPEEGLPQAEQVIKWIQNFDADDRVMVIWAHDIDLFGTLEYFPNNANDWRSKGWKENGRWAFLVNLQTIARGPET